MRCDPLGDELAGGAELVRDSDGHPGLGELGEKGVTDPRCEHRAENACAENAPDLKRGRLETTTMPTSARGALTTIASEAETITGPMPRPSRTKGTQMCP